MQRKSISLLTLVLVLLLFTVSCSQAIHTVKFDSNGGSAVADQPVEDGKTVVKPIDPTKDGNTFSGWYTDTSLTNEYDFNTPVKNDLRCGILPL